MHKVVVALTVSVVTFCFSHVRQAFPQGCEQAKEIYSEGVVLNDGSEQEADFYRQAISLCPKYAEAYYRLANVYAGWGQTFAKR